MSRSKTGAATLRPIVLGVILVFLSIPLSGIQVAFAHELFLCRNEIVQEPIQIQQIQLFREKKVDRFRPGDRIVAVYLFQTDGTEESVEFRWMRRIDRLRWAQQHSYFHTIRQKTKGSPYVTYAWVILDPSFFDKILGSRFSGDWSVEVFVNNRKREEANFTVGHD